MEINKYDIAIDYLKRYTGKDLSQEHIKELEAILAESDGKIYPKRIKVRPIIFLESAKFNVHEGYVFNRIDDAQKFLVEEMGEGFFQSAHVGYFVDDPDYDSPQVGIMQVDIVKKKQEKKVSQLRLFK
jgi:hypothetical protein